MMPERHVLEGASPAGGFPAAAAESRRHLVRHPAETQCGVLGFRRGALWVCSGDYEASATTTDRRWRPHETGHRGDGGGGLRGSKGGRGGEGHHGNEQPCTAGYARAGSQHSPTRGRV